MSRFPARLAALVAGMVMLSMGAFVPASAQALAVAPAAAEVALTPAAGGSVTAVTPLAPSLAAGVTYTDKRTSIAKGYTRYTCAKPKYWMKPYYIWGYWAPAYTKSDGTYVAKRWVATRQVGGHYNYRTWYNGACWNAQSWPSLDSCTYNMDFTKSRSDHECGYKKPDTCTYGDKSGSRYDGKCAAPVTNTCPYAEAGYKRDANGNCGILDPTYCATSWTQTRTVVSPMPYSHKIWSSVCVGSMNYAFVHDGKIHYRGIYDGQKFDIYYGTDYSTDPNGVAVHELIFWNKAKGGWYNAQGISPYPMAPR